MKAAVKKAESLILVGALAMKKAKTEEEKVKVKMAIKGSMTKVMGKLKADVADLKMQAQVAKDGAKAADGAADMGDEDAQKTLGAVDGADKDEGQEKDGEGSTYPEDDDKWIFEHPHAKTPPKEEEEPKEDQE